jgi:hypothetical protein
MEIQDTIITLNEIGLFRKISRLIEPQEEIRKTDTLIGKLNGFQKVLFTRLNEENFLLNKMFENGNSSEEEIIKKNLLVNFISNLFVTSVFVSNNIWTDKSLAVRKGFNLVIVGEEPWKEEEEDSKNELSYMFLSSNFNLYKS